MPLEFWILAVALVVAVVATVVCLLKGRRVYGLVGVGASILVAALLFEAREVDDEMLEGASLLIGFVFFGLPLTILVVAGASQPGKPSSWWAKKPSRKK